jgi:hypothetical protein
MKDTEYSSICTVQYYFSHLSITKSSKVGKTLCDLYLFQKLLPLISCIKVLSSEMDLAESSLIRQVIVKK